MEDSKIEWTDHTFNPWRGCEKVSPGCKNCYAMLTDKRYHGDAHWGPGSSRAEHTESYWAQLRLWDKAAGKIGRIARVFCGSMCDILEADIRVCNECGAEVSTLKDDCPRCDGDMREQKHRHGLGLLRTRLFNHVNHTPNLIYLFLTKRPENYRYFPAEWLQNWPQNAMLGFTAENDEMLLKRWNLWKDLRDRTIGLRTFISGEPLLSALPSMEKVLGDGGIDWVIGGGESQDGARPSHPAWYRGLANACSIYSVPYLHKQWGEWLPYDQRLTPLTPLTYEAQWNPKRAVTIDIKGTICGEGEQEGWAVANKALHLMPTGWVGKKAAGRLLDGKEYNGLPGYWPANVGMPPKPKKQKNPLEVIA